MIGFGSDSERQPSTVEAIKHRRAHDVMCRPCFSLTVKLRSGEQLSYAEIGDKAGYPVVWIPGPNYNRFLMAIYENMAIESGLRIICFDRPGRGASTPLRHPKLWEFRSLAGYIDELTSILGINKFFIIGHSIGSSYALASYEFLKHKIIGPLRLLGTWAPSNLPCMPVSYAIQRSLPTRMLRGVYSLSTNSSLSSTRQIPTQMGAIGSRELINTRDRFVHQVLERVAEDHATDAYKAFELDWLLALEINKPFGFDHRALTCSVKCWHGMDDTISPLGASMWMQREMKQFLLYAVEGATHNIILDFAIVRAVMMDISKEAATVFLKPTDIAAVTPTASPTPSSDVAPVVTCDAQQNAPDTDDGPLTPTSMSESPISKKMADLPHIPTPDSSPAVPQQPGMRASASSENVWAD